MAHTGNSLLTDLHINTRMEVEVPEGPWQGIYQSRVEDMTPAELAIALPTAGRRPVLLDPGQAVRCRFISRRACYQFDAQVLDRRAGPVPVVVLAMPGEWERLQRRHFARLDVSVPVRYSPRLPGGGPLADRPLISARTRDLSGDGCAIWTVEPPDPGTELDLFLSLPPGQVLHLAARVVRLTGPSPAGRVLTGLRFVAPAEADRDAIIRYLFREELRRRRNGLV